MERHSLDHCTVLVTRPKGRGEPLCKAIEARGGKGVFQPTLEILPTEKPGLAEGQISLLRDMDMVVFISPTAVEMAKPFWQKHFSQWPKGPEAPRILAVGEGTARALEQAEITVHSFPAETYSSTALLQLPEFQTLTFDSVMIVKGEGGNPILEQTLSAAGSQVVSVNVYRRGLPAMEPGELAELWNAKATDCVVSTSGESLRNLVQLLGPTHQALFHNTPLMVISSNMVKLARELGYTGHLLQAPNATNDAIVTTLEAWWATQSQKDVLHDSELECIS